MVFEALEIEGTTILFLTGEMDAASCVQMRTLLPSLMAGGQRQLAVDLSGVDRMYAAGMSLLLDLQRQLSRTGGRLVCCGARPFIREMLRITLLDQALNLQADLDSALDLLRAAS